MEVLIVESQPELGYLWQACLERQGMKVTVAVDHDEALEALRKTPFEMIILDLILAKGQALGIADYASYRRPEARIIFVTNTSFFSDGSIFQLSPNACAFVQSATPPEDLAAMVQHYASAT
ncbi:response regulator [Planktotalea arctica]|uniref:response regulator n=1 Tax=Planktotalea arctica TaxID=1481893 RepID=UPI00321B7911